MVKTGQEVFPLRAQCRRVLEPTVLEVTQTAHGFDIHGRRGKIAFGCEMHIHGDHPHMLVKNLNADGGKGAGKGEGRKTFDLLEEIARGLGLRGIKVWQGSAYWDKQKDFRRLSFPVTHVKDL